MTDTASRNPVGAPALIADSLLRSVSGASAFLRLSAAATGNAQAEMGIAQTQFVTAEISPVVMRRTRPSFKEGEPAGWELLVSATSVARQLATFDVASARALFQMTQAVSVAGQDYLIESVSSNEAFGQVYLYRLLLREARQQAV